MIPSTSDTTEKQSYIDQHDSDKAWTDHFELLVRSILVRPDQPAVIVLGHFSPQVMETHGFYGPEIYHSVVAQYYDVPHIRYVRYYSEILVLTHPYSVKPTLYPTWITQPDSVNSYYADPVLANPTGHELIADILIHYIESQVCAAWSVATGLTFDVVSPLLSSNGDAPSDPRGLFGGLGPKKGSSSPSDNTHNPHAHVPFGRISSKPTDTRRFEEVKPDCVSANDLINPLPPSLFTGSGWHAYHPPPGSTVGQTVYAHYWYSTLPTSKLRIPIQAGAGDIAVYYLKEPLADVENVGSAVECWVDDNYAGAKMLVNTGDVGEITPV